MFQWTQSFRVAFLKMSDDDDVAAKVAAALDKPHKPSNRSRRGHNGSWSPASSDSDDEVDDGRPNDGMPVCRLEINQDELAAAMKRASGSQTLHTPQWRPPELLTLQTLTQSAFAPAAAFPPTVPVNLAGQKRDLFGLQNVNIAPGIARLRPLELPPAVAAAAAAASPRKKRKSRPTKEGKESKTRVVKPIAPELDSLTVEDMKNVFY